MKRALITGITGQDGSYLTEFLLAKNYEVHGLIRRASLFNTERIDHLYHDPHDQGPGMVLHYGDLSDGTVLRRTLESVRPDEVYNLGAQSHVKVSFEMPEYTADVVGLGALRLFEAVRDHQEHRGEPVRIYQAGSSEMYGAAPAPQSEATPFHPRSPYAVSKVAAHWYAVNYRESYGMFISNGILFNHESPRRGETFVTRKITRAVGRIKVGLQDKLFLGNIDAKRDWGFAGDYVEAMWLMLQQDKPDDYVVATGKSYSVRDFLEKAFGLADLDWKKYVEFDLRYLRPAEVDHLQGDARKARAQLNWQPRVSFDALVQMMVEHDSELGRQELTLRTAGHAPVLRGCCRAMSEFALDGRRIFVAGHRGMVGRAIVRRLAAVECEILAAPRGELDLVDQRATFDWMERHKPDVVIVAAAKVGGILANNTYPADFLYQNLAIEANLIEGARRAGVAKLLFLGSSCIYPKFADQPIAEASLLTGPLEPTNEWYAVAKIAGIKLCDAYRRQYGCDFISAMPTNLYGPFDNFDLRSSHVLPALLAKLHRARIEGLSEMPVWGTGTPRREFLHVDDLADAALFLLQHFSGEGPINVGTGEDLSINELAAMAAGIVGWTGRFVHELDKPDGTPRKLLDVSLLAGLGWRARIPLEDGIRDTYRWYVDQLAAPEPALRGAGAAA